MGDSNVHEHPSAAPVLELPLEKPGSKDSVENGPNDNKTDSYCSVLARTDHDQTTSASSDDQRSNNSKRSSTPEPEFGPDGEEIFYVDKILKKKILKTGQPLYFVKWKNYSDKYNTWEPPSSFHSSSVITQYEKKVQREMKKKTERARKRYVMARDPDPDYDEIPKYLKNKKPYRETNGTSRSLSTDPEKVTPQQSSTSPAPVTMAEIEATHCTVKAEEASTANETVQDQVIKTEEGPDTATSSSNTPSCPLTKNNTDASEMRSGQPASETGSPGCMELSADDLERIEQRKRNYQKCAKKSVGKAEKKAKPVTNIHPLHTTTKESGVSVVPSLKKVSKIEALLLVKKKKVNVDLDPLPLTANVQISNIAKVMPVPIRKKPKTVAQHPEPVSFPERIYVSDDSSEEEYSNGEDSNTTEFTVIKDGTQSIVFEESRSRFGVFKNPSAQR